MNNNDDDEDNDERGLLLLLTDTCHSEDEEEEEEDDQEVVQLTKNPVDPLEPRIPQLLPPRRKDSTHRLMREIQAALEYVRGLSNTADEANCKQTQKWREQKMLLEREAKHLDMQYRELAGTIKNIDIIKHQLQAVIKDQRKMKASIEALQKQEEAAMEAEIRKHEEALFSQYRKMSVSGPSTSTSTNDTNRISELEGLRTMVSQKRKALELLDELIGRAIANSACSLSSNNACGVSSNNNNNNNNNNNSNNNKDNSNTTSSLSLKTMVRRSSRCPTTPRSDPFRIHARARRRLDRTSTIIVPTPPNSDSSTEIVRNDNNFRTLFGDLFSQINQDEPSIIPLNYFETSV